MKMMLCWPRFAVFLVVCLTMLPAIAGAQNAPGSAHAYVVEGIEVDVTADTAASARQIALRRGQMEAFSVLLRRMTLSEDRGRLPRLDGLAVESLVSSIEFDSERYSTTRYIAELTVGFNGEEIRRLLQLSRIPYAEAMSRPVLVLPVYQDAGAVSLWDRPNGWWDAWSAADLRSGLVSFMLPDGSLSDLATLSADQALRGSMESLEALGRRYKTTEVLVAFARWSTNLDTGEPQIVVEAHHHGFAGERVTEFDFSMADGEPEDEFLVRAATGIGDAMAQSWKKNALVGHGLEQSLTATLDIGSLKDLMAARDRFGQAPMIRALHIDSLSITQAVFRFTYSGDQEQLSVSLSQYGIELIESDDGWHLTLRQ